MALAKDTDPRTSGISDWLLELAIGAFVLVLGVSVWAYTHFSSQKLEQTKPVPVWLTVPKVMAQTSDGRMFNVKFNLRLGKQKDVSVMEPHIPAFKTLVQEAGTQMSRDDMKDADGLVRFGKTVKTSLNGYLKAQDVQARVKDVALDEIMFLP